MQKIIFVCLLALSMCLCSPTEEKGNKKPVPVTNAVPKTPEVTVPPHEATPSPTEHVTTNATSATSAPPTIPTAASTTNLTTKIPAESSTPKEAITTKPTKANETTVPTTKAPVTTEKAASSTPKGEVTTPKTTTIKPAADDAHTVQTRKFDGPSFIGGIIMTLGLLAVSFMGYKYYKNQTERNYHTL